MTSVWVMTMRISTFLYTLRQGAKNIWKNKMFSLASIATMSACIFLFGVFYSVVVNFQNVVREVESGVAITVFFVDGASQEQMDEIGVQIGKRVEVSKKVFVSAEQAWDEFQKVYFEGAEEMAEGFTNDNPLANSAHYEVYMNDISMQQSLVTFIQSLDGVKEVKSSDLAANTLTDFNRLIGYVSAGIILILLCVAVFLISNTVTIGIAVRREEIAIMRMVGATNSFIRLPFVVQGFLLGIIAAAVAFFLEWGLYDLFSAKIASIDTMRLVSMVPFQDVLIVMVIFYAVTGFCVGVFGSLMSIRKFLKV